jgi:hypothetical protein
VLGPLIRRDGRAYQVIDPDGRVGVVTGVRSSEAGGEPDQVVVASGLFKTHEVVVPADDVVSVNPSRRRVMLARRVERS